MKKSSPTRLKKLSSYSALATSLITLPWLAHSQVIYTDINPDFVGVPDDSYALDLNNDGTSDFIIAVGSHFFVPFFQLAYVSIIPSPGNAVARGNYGPGVFFAGSDIDSNLNWNEDGFQRMGQASLSYSGGVSSFDYSGSWLNVYQGYLALRFKIDGTDHYGWARLSTNVLNVFDPELTAYDYAYSPFPEAPLKAGDGILSACDVAEDLFAVDIASSSVNLVWNPVSDAVAYAVSYKTMEASEWTVVRCYGNRKTLSGLQAGTIYAWQVQSICSQSPAIYSAPSLRSKFTTAPLRLAAGAGNASVEVFPNPVSSSATISILTQEESYGLIELFDVSGIKLQTILNENLSGGNHEVMLNRGLITSGVYLLKVTIGNKSEVKKIIFE